MDPLLGDCSLAVLRQRRSWKWTRFPPDVIPAWVAEMDFDLAEPVKEAVRAVISSGDAGYSRPQPAGFGEAYAAFSAQQWGWAPDPGRVFAVPDVMTGIAEVLYGVTPHGSGWCSARRSTRPSSTGCGWLTGRSSRRRCAATPTVATSSTRRP